jgi:hypothetical protein
LQENHSHRPPRPVAKSTTRRLSASKPLYRELGAQFGVFGLERLKPIAQRLDRSGNVPFGEPRSDVLRAVPVKRLKMQREDALGLGFLGRFSDQRRERRVGRGGA